MAPRWMLVDTLGFASGALAYAAEQSLLSTLHAEGASLGREFVLLNADEIRATLPTRPPEKYSKAFEGSATSCRPCSDLRYRAGDTFETALPFGIRALRVARRPTGRRHNLRDLLGTFQIRRHVAARLSPTKACRAALSRERSTPPSRGRWTGADRTSTARDRRAVDGRLRVPACAGEARSLAPASDRRGEPTPSSRTKSYGRVLEGADRRPDPVRAEGAVLASDRVATSVPRRLRPSGGPRMLTSAARERSLRDGPCGSGRRERAPNGFADDVPVPPANSDRRASAPAGAPPPRWRPGRPPSAWSSE